MFSLGNTVASTIGLQLSQQQTVIFAIVLVIVACAVIKMFWRFIAVGVMIVVVLMWYSRNSDSPNVTAVVGAVTQQVAAPVAEAVNPSVLPSAKLKFVKDCVAEGENNTQECFELWAEKEYPDSESKAEVKEVTTDKSVRAAEQAASDNQGE
jgi:hypothetical protein